MRQFDDGGELQTSDLLGQGKLPLGYPVNLNVDCFPAFLWILFWELQSVNSRINPLKNKYINGYTRRDLAILVTQSNSKTE